MNIADSTDSVYSISLEPFGPIGIISHTANSEFAHAVNNILYEKRLNRVNSNANPYVNTPGYLRNDYVFDTKLIRFQTGEGKFEMGESSRGHDIYIITDVLSYNQNINVSGEEHIVSPDDHYRDLLRIISACAGKAKRINVIMPFVYQGLQDHKSTSYESLDCAAVLKQLYSLGVANLIIFDPHDGRITNAVPLMGIEMPKSAYKIIYSLLSKFDSIKTTPDSTVVVAPDETGINRAVFYSSMLNLPLGIFYRQKDYSKTVNGSHPIKEYKFLGDNIKGKDVLIIDDMINTGDTMLRTCEKLKDLGANDIFCIAPFGLFTTGLNKFDEAYKSNLFKGVLCTNLVYRTPELLSRKWYTDVNMTPYVARIIDALNMDESVGNLINSTSRITEFLDQIRIGELIDEFN